jgi:hypothetical protein
LFSYRGEFIGLQNMNDRYLQPQPFTPLPEYAETWCAFAFLVLAQQFSADPKLCAQGFDADPLLLSSVAQLN